MAAQRISILGGGLMGHGIALVFAGAGHHVRITDPSGKVRA
ncbi:MAG: 3-hydroxyacyl-CoA dehydrogenase NAD-binding domain-containing protein, partial [Xanthobacteraceae bacterium]